MVEVALEVFESGCPHACAALELLPKALLLLGGMGGQVELSGGWVGCMVWRAQGHGFC